MIYEYALDPALVVNWAIAGMGQTVMQFGLDQRRLVSDFPKDWKNRVVGNFYEHFEYDDTSLEFQNAQPDLDAYLQILTEYMVYRDIDLPIDNNWLNSAISEHSCRPFYAIFTIGNDDNCSLSRIITERDIGNIQNTHWWLPTVKPTRKSSVEIATVLKPLLKICREIHLVDPYFDFKPEDPRFINTLIEIINQSIFSRRAVQCIPSIRIVTGVERNGETNDQQAEKFAKNIYERAKQHLPKKIPNSISIELIILKNLTQGNPLHNRYLLTDIGGVIIPYGLDDYDRESDHGAEDDLEPMHKGVYEKRWNQYVKLNGVKIVLGPKKIC
jgi:hypothetical protein